jgi:hypothetical protein
MAKDLITLAEYKAYQKTTKTDDDVKINLLIGMASNFIKTYLGSSLVDNYDDPITEVINLDYDTSVLYTAQYPIREIISITEYDSSHYDSTIHLPLDPTSDFILSNDTIIRRRDGRNFSWYRCGGNSVIEIVYTAGYETVPNDLKLATILLVEYYLKENYIQNRTIMGTSITNVVSGGLPPYIATILDMYSAIL